jgi:hypothetical protein
MLSIHLHLSLPSGLFPKGCLPAWGLGMGLTTPHRKKQICYEKVFILTHTKNLVYASVVDTAEDLLQFIQKGYLLVLNNLTFFSVCQPTHYLAEVCVAV